MTEQPKLEDFPLHDYDKLRFGDTDMLGHVNNAVFATLFETGRSALLALPGLDAWDLKTSTFVTARLELDYLAEALWPGIMRVGTGIKSVGNSSAVLVQALFQEQKAAAPKCVAKAQTVMVHLDLATKRPAPLPPEMREALTKLIVKA